MRWRTATDIPLQSMIDMKNAAKNGRLPIVGDMTDPPDLTRFVAEVFDSPP